MVGAKINYIQPFPRLPDNLKFTFNMKYKSLSSCDLLAPILYAATVGLGGAISTLTLFRIEDGSTVRPNKVHPTIRFLMHF